MGVKRAALGLLIAALLAAGLPLHAQDDDPPPAPPLAQFGVVGDVTALHAATQLDADWIMLPFAWADLQPEPDAELDLSAIDGDALAAAQANERTVVGVITTTPAWASASGESTAVPDGLDLPVDDPGNLWAGFVAALVTEYAPLGVSQWALYTQPDVAVGEGRVGFAGDASDYAKLFTVAAQTAAEIDPQTQFLTGPLIGWTDAAAGREPYLARLFDAFDPAVPLPLGGVVLRAENTTSGAWDMLTTTRAILDTAQRPDLPVWLIIASHTEGLTALTPERQADFVLQITAAGLASGAEYIGLALTPPETHNTLWGMVQVATSDPVWSAYRQALALHAAATSAEVYRTANAALVRLQTPERDLYVAWAVDAQPVTFTITAPEIGIERPLYPAYGAAATITANAEEWPAAYSFTVPAAAPNANGFVIASGAPQTLVLDRRDDFFRVIYATVNGTRARLR